MQSPFGQTIEENVVMRTAKGSLVEITWHESDPQMFGWAELDPVAYANGQRKYGNSGNDPMEQLPTFLQAR